jgi:hypothetical protein
MKKTIIFIVLICILSMPYIGAHTSENNIIEIKKASNLINDDWYWYPTFENYAPYGMPDFDQKQDNWKHSTLGYWSFCGPTSLSNILWYFDSMHSDLSGYPGDGIDNYPLVRDYNAPSNPHPGPYSDDHNINNVNDILTTWNPENSEYGNELIEKIAWYTDNDGCQSEDFMI